LYNKKNRANYYLRKLIKIGELEDDKDKNRLLNDLEGTDVTELLIELKEEILLLKKRYRGVWLKYNRPDNLWMIEDKFDRMVHYLSETSAEVKENSIKSPEINSKWLYHKLDDKYASSAQFKKEFTLKEKPVSAKLQFLGDNFVKLFINDNYIDQVFARRTLSLMVDYHRIKYLDVTDELRKGENTFEIKAESYYREASAGFNLICTVEYENGETDTIISDSTWVSMEKGSEDWGTPSLKDYKWKVIAPHFETDRTSWIER